MRHPSDELTLLGEIPGKMSAYGWCNVLIVCWPQPSDVPGVVALSEARARFMDHHPEGVSVVQITAQASVPNAETSATWLEMMRRHSDRLRCIAVVIAGEGFKASALQSWVTDKRMVRAPGDFKMRFHTSVEDVLRWLPAEHKRRTGVQLDQAIFLRHLQELRASMPSAVATTD